MAFTDTIKDIRNLLAVLTLDIEKAAGGNKAASQRVRTGTIKLEKVAKRFRKESITAEKSGVMKKLHAAKKAAKAAPARAKVKHAVKAKVIVKPKAKAKFVAKKVAPKPMPKAKAKPGRRR